MKFLVSFVPSYVNQSLKISIAPPDEPVIPAFPAPVVNMFLSVKTYKYCPVAIVKNIDLNLNEVISNLCSQFPGLPERLHKEYVYRTQQAAEKLPIDTKVRAIITQDTATLVIIEESNTNPLKNNKICLWERQPI